MWVSPLPQQRDGQRDGGDGGVRGREWERRWRRAARAGSRAGQHAGPPQSLRSAPQVAARLPRARPLGRLLSTRQEKA